MPKKIISKRDKMLADHAAFLRRMGVDPTKRRGKLAAVASPLDAAPYTRPTPAVPLSDIAPANGPRKCLQMRHARGEETDDTIQQIKSRQQGVAQLYPKGPYGLVSDPDHLKSNVRRPPT